MSPWVTMTIVEKQGMGDDGAVLLAFVACCTRPALIATVGCY